MAGATFGKIARSDWLLCGPEWPPILDRYSGPYGFGRTSTKYKKKSSLEKRPGSTNKNK